MGLGLEFLTVDKQRSRQNRNYIEVTVRTDKDLVEEGVVGVGVGAREVQHESRKLFGVEIDRPPHRRLRKHHRIDLRQRVFRF